MKRIFSFDPSDWKLKGLIRPVCLMIVFSLLGSLAYYSLEPRFLSWPQPFSALFDGLLLSLLDFGLYLLALTVWKRPVRRTLAKSGWPVYGLCLGFGLWSRAIFEPIAFQSNAFFDGLALVLGLFTIFVLIPGGLILGALFSWQNGSNKKVFSTAKTIVGRRGWKIEEIWLTVFLIMVLWDTLFGGPLNFSPGIAIVKTLIPSLLGFALCAAYPSIITVYALLGIVPFWAVPFAWAGLFFKAYLMCVLFRAIKKETKASEDSNEN